MALCQIKNAVYSIASDGNIDHAYIYNQGGSHYTRLRKDIDGGYVLSNFSNFFSPSFEFLPLIVKMNDNYESGCNRIDVSGEIEIAFEDWDIQDITYTKDTGDEVTNFSPESDFTFSFTDVQCVEVPQAEADFTYADAASGLEGTFDFTNTSPSPGLYHWDFDDGNTSEEENPEHTYYAIGDYEVCLTLFANCDTVVVCKMVEVDEVPVNVMDLTQSPYRVFPNPIVEDIFLQSSDNFIGLQQIKLYNVDGKLLYQESPSGKLYQSQIRIPAKDLPAGMYYLEILLDDKTYSQKVVK